MVFRVLSRRGRKDAWRKGNKYVHVEFARSEQKRLKRLGLKTKIVDLDVYTEYK